MTKILSTIVLIVSTLSPFGLWPQEAGAGSRCLIHGVGFDGPIVIAKIEDVKPGTNASPRVATVAVQEYVRGSNLTEDALHVIVDWNGDPHYIRRPPMWFNIDPVVGKSILLSYTRPYSGGRLVPTCVVDLDNNGAQTIETIRKLVALQKLSPENDQAQLEQALSDPSATVRSYANLKLTPAVRASGTRRRIFEEFAPIAETANDPRRSEAIGMIESDFDIGEPNSEINSQILSMMADLTADPDSHIRSIAIQYLYSKFFNDLKNKPDPTLVRPKNPEQVKQRLQQDINEQRPHAEEAKKLLDLLGKKQQS